MSPEKFVVFDAVGTIIEPDPSVAEIYQQVALQHNHNVSLEELKSRISQAVPEFFGHARVEKGAPWASSDAIERSLWKSVVSSVFSELEKERLDPLFDDLWNQFANPEVWRVYPDVEDCLEQLTEQGWLTIVGSNFDSRVHAVLRGLPQLSRINEVYCSAEVGYRKPGENFYANVEYQLRNRHVIPEEAPIRVVMIGDDWKNDVVGPLQFGWQAVWLNRGGQEMPSLGRTELMHDKIASCANLHEFAKSLV